MGEPDGLGPGIDRRSFLLRSGAAVGTVSLWGLGGSRVASAFADLPAVLPSAAQATFGALVDTVESAGGLSLEADDAAAVLAQLVSVFADSSADEKNNVLFTLGVLEAAPAAGGFSTLDQPSRQAFLNAFTPGADPSLRAAGTPGAASSPGRLLDLVIGGITIGPIRLPGLHLEIGGQPDQVRDELVAATLYSAAGLVALGFVNDPFADASLMPPVPEADAFDPGVWDEGPPSEPS